MTENSKGWRNRITGHGEKSADQFQAHPRNWRQHPKAQREALSASLNGVGWVDTVIENVTTGNLIDGHERIWQALNEGDDTPVPFTQVELSEEEELIVLATFDPIGEMAVADAKVLEGLLSDLRLGNLATDNSGVNALLHEVAARNDVPYGEFSDKEAADGSLLALVGVTLDEPRHVVERGDVWRLGHHILVCAEVLTGWQQWKPFLSGDMIFAPFPGSFVPLSLRADDTPFLLVQPDTYIAGHILDRYEEIKGEEEIRRGA